MDACVASSPGMMLQAGLGNCWEGKGSDCDDNEEEKYQIFQ